MMRIFVQNKSPVLRALFSVFVMLAIFVLSDHSFAHDKDTRTGQSAGFHFHYEVIAVLEQAPGNIAATANGRLFISKHQFYNPEYRVVEILPDGSTRPYPNEQWASAPGEDGIGLQSVLGIRGDKNNILWMLDNGSDPKRIVAWDTNKEELHRIIELSPEAAPPGSFPNDMALDPINNHIYIADIGGDYDPAIIVVNLEDGSSRRVLSGTHVVMPEDNAEMVIDGKAVRLKNEDGSTQVARVGVNPITIDRKSYFVYFGAMHGHNLYRIEPRFLIDTAMTDDQLVEKVELYAKKPVSDGISIDDQFNIYVTDLNNNGLGVILALTRTYKRFESHFELPGHDHGPSLQTKAAMIEQLKAAARGETSSPLSHDHGSHDHHHGHSHGSDHDSGDDSGHELGHGHEDAQANKKDTLEINEDNLLSWPDAITAGQGSLMYVTSNQLHRSAYLNLGEDISEKPYYVLRFIPPGSISVGR